MKNFIYKFYYYWFLLFHKKDTHIVKQETQFWKANLIQWITHLFHGKYLKKAAVQLERLKSSISNVNNFLVHRDDFGNETRISLPILTPAEAIRMRRGRTRHLLLLLAFLLIDSFLFSMIADYYLPETDKAGHRFIFGLVLAILIVVGWEMAFSLTFKSLYFFGKKENRGQPGSSKMLILGLLGVFLLVVMGYLSFYLAKIRELVIEPGAQISYGSELENNSGTMVHKAGEFASYASVIISYLTGLLLGISNITTENFGERGRVYRKYSKLVRKIHRQKVRFENYCARLESELKDQIEQNWKMVIYIRNVLRRDTDEVNAPMADEFRALKRSQGFYYSADIYPAFEEVQSMDELLFKLGVAISETNLLAESAYRKIREEYEDLIRLYNQLHQVKPVDLAIKPTATQLLLRILPFVLLLQTSCTQVKHRPVSYQVFIDRSFSIPLEAREFYYTVNENVLRNLQPGDELRVFPVDMRTRSHAQELLHLKCPDKKEFENRFDPPAMKAKNQAMRWDSYCRKLSDSLRTLFVRLEERETNLKKGTDVLGAFDIAQGYSEADGKEKVLIVCSDMQHSDSQWNFSRNYTNPNFIKGFHQKVAEKLAKGGFSACYLITGPGLNMDIAQFEATQSFWDDAMKEAHIKDYLFVSGQYSLISERLNRFKSRVDTSSVDYF